MLPANVGFLEDVFHVVFIEIVSFDRYGAVSLRIVVNVVISTVVFQFITIHNFVYKSIKNTQKYTKRIERGECLWMKRKYSKSATR